LSVAFAPALGTALRRPALRPFWLAQFLVYLAQQAWQTLVLWALLRLTGQAAWVALGLVAQSVPAIVVGVVGPARLRPPRGLFLLPLGAGVCLLALALVMATGAPPTVAASVLLAGAVAEGLLAAAQVPLLQADLARAVAPGSLAAANAAMEFSSSVGGLAGPVLCGLALAGPGIVATLAGAAVVMVLAAPAVAAWQRRTAMPTLPRGGQRRAGVAGGLRTAASHVRGDTFVRTALATRTVNNLLWPVLTVALPLLVADRWHAGALGYGLLLGARGLGGLVGTALGARLGSRGLASAFFAAWVVEAMAFVGLAVSPQLSPALLCTAVAGVASPLIHVALDSRIGRAVAEEARGAVFGLQRMAMSAAGLAGSLGAGAALGLLPVEPVLAAAGAAVAACAVAGYGVARRGGGLDEAAAGPVGGGR